MERFYPIGTPGQPWSENERAQWVGSRVVHRSYGEEVLTRLEGLDARLSVKPYGSLSVDSERYPLVAARSDAAGSAAPWALITGGVHGYETSGVQGAIAFLRHLAPSYLERVNLVVAPCVSPWGYERVERWNALALDPNRSFGSRPPTEESAALTKMIEALGVSFALHIDLHETTDSDEGEFRPAVAARDGKPFEPGSIPDGFYLVGDSARPEPAFQAAIIAAVEKVTHIAPADADGKIIGCAVKQPGVIEFPVAQSGLCAGLTTARFTTTTEVYPDSPRATPELCVEAQLAAVRAGLDHLLSSPSREGLAARVSSGRSAGRVDVGRSQGRCTLPPCGMTVWPRTA